MNTRPNKHGFVGVRKRTDYPWRRKPYYARFAIAAEQFVYSQNFATAEEAASAYEAMKAEHRNRSITSTVCADVTQIPNERQK